MRLSGVRRATMAAGLATVAAVALSACSAGQVAETALTKPSNSGVNATTTDNSVAVRNLQVVYNGPEGYASGASAPIEVAIFNQTKAEVIVTITARPASGPMGASARQVGLTGGAPSTAPSAAPEPSGSRPPATPDTETPENQPSASEEPSTAPSEEPSTLPTEAPLAPARITIEPLGYASFLPGDEQQLVLAGLSGKLTPGMSVTLVFEFSNGAAPLMLDAPVSVPESPAPRGSAIEGEGHETE